MKIIGKNQAVAKTRIPWGAWHPNSLPDKHHSRRGGRKLVKKQMQRLYIPEVRRQEKYSGEFHFNLMLLTFLIGISFCVMNTLQDIALLVVGVLTKSIRGLLIFSLSCLILSFLTSYRSFRDLNVSSWSLERFKLFYKISVHNISSHWFLKGCLY